MFHSGKKDRKGVWAIVWRMCLLFPIVWITGLAVFFLIIASFIAPPLYAAYSFSAGNWITGILTLLPWFVLLRYSKPILAWTFEGIDEGP